MDKNLKLVIEKRIERTVKALREHNIDAQYIPDTQALLQKLGEYINEGTSCGVGGSMTLFETGVIDYLRSSGCEYYGKAASNTKDLISNYRQSFFCDVYVTSSNAITEDGELYNVDGTGNRVAALTFGPSKVIVIAGANKIVRNLDEARRRIKYTAAPANNIRLEKPNPCVKTGVCMECRSPTNICITEVVTRGQSEKGRLTVLILPDSYGY